MGNSKRIAVAAGVDVGSSNTKVVILDSDGAVVARVIRPTPRDGLLIDALALFLAIEEMIATACGGLFEVHAICSAGIGEDGVLVDGNLRPLTRGLAWFDPRRHSVFDELRPHLEDGEPFDASSDAGRTFVGWAWARDQPGASSAVAWVAITDLVSVHWTGRPFLSETLASRTSAWRTSRRAWDESRVQLALGSLGLLPPVMATGEVVGAIDSPRLRELGVVAADAVAVVGGHDHPIAGWGVDRMSPGVVLDSMGTAEVVVAQSRSQPGERVRDIDIAPGIRSGGTTLLRVEELARNVQWASRDAEVAGHIRSMLDGSVAALPVLDSKYFIPGRRGGGTPGYAPDTPADPRVRASAVLGALAHAGRDAVNAVRAAGADMGEVCFAGGWARSSGWLEIKTAVNGYRAAPILEPQVTAVGAALLAAEARGWRPDPVRAFAGFAAPLLS
ncbi:FGGY family carbohydrate kinase [Leifsonia poae]|uniref:FGGY family carbohydrate kinase n=1 Tax=Leifsonia poae TaxID=110933 RepID=UPI001CC04F81|nr:FGGY family carbohydrate kinase [Leifsonia poae]